MDNIFSVSFSHSITIKKLKFFIDSSNKSQEMFEATCDQRFGAFSIDDDEDPWADRTKEIQFDQGDDTKLSKKRVSEYKCDSSSTCFRFIMLFSVIQGIPC